MEFTNLMQKNYKRAYYTALGLLGNHDDAMEISQKAFIRAYNNIEKFDKSKNFFTWFYIILRNLCFNHIRDTKRKKEVSFVEYEVKDEVQNPQEIVERKEVSQKVEASLMMLDAKDREILVMKEFEHMSYKDISKLLDVPMGTVMSRLFYARKKLSELLKSEKS